LEAEAPETPPKEAVTHRPPLLQSYQSALIRAIRHTQSPVSSHEFEQHSPQVSPQLQSAAHATPELMQVASGGASPQVPSAAQ
jgi:hypothetical protein